MTGGQAPLHENRERAASFGSSAELYDRTRPRYPEELYAYLLADAPRTALDVGCGTGIAARRLQRLGLEVLGVELDERMAAVARESGVPVEVATFEGWDRQGRTFDLLTAGQAWHWIDPQAGAARAAEAVRPGGRIAVFWNLAQPPADLASRIDPVYARLAPELQPYSVVLGQGGGPARLRSAHDALTADGSWQDLEQLDFGQEIAYSRDGWLDYLRTHSDHSTLPAERLQPLLDAVGQAIDGMGGRFVMPFRTAMVTAVRS
jgi:SAM-dependent methyltransferase